MTNLLNQQVKKWLSDNLNLVIGRSSVSIHINELLGRELTEPTKKIEFTIQAFLELVEGIKKLQTSVKPGIVIPLKSISHKIERSAPHNLEAIKSQLDVEPPSLYLINRIPPSYFATFEEYSCPLTFQIVDRKLQEIYTYYKEVRFETAIENDWEFARGVYAEYYPDSL